MTKTRARSCDGKQAHPSKREALDHAFSLRRAGAAAGAVQIYQCKFCTLWHVGHRRRGGKP